MADPDSLPGWIRWHGQDLLLDITVQPGARSSGPAGILNNRLKLRISAPPVEGAANEAVIRYIAKLLKIPKSRVAIIRGSGDRRKTLCCKTCGPAHLNNLVTLLNNVD